jgi:DNA repair protein RecO (recombination protein O)
MSYKTEAIILDAKECREYDRIYTIFSKEKGKISVIGVGTRKPKAKLASGLEPLTKSELFMVKCRGLDRVKGVLIDNQYQAIRGDYEKMVLVRRTLKILRKLLPEAEQCEDIYEALSSFLELANKLPIENNPENKQQVAFAQLALFWKGIAWSGTTPSLYHCTDCREKIRQNDKFIFSVPNGLKCQNCFGEKESHSFYISANAVKLLRIFLKEDREVLKKVKSEERTLAELYNVTKYILSYTTEGKIFF